jgi:hypothetical protein
MGTCEQKENHAQFLLHSGTEVHFEPILNFVGFTSENVIMMCSKGKNREKSCMFFNAFTIYSGGFVGECPRCVVKIDPN